MEQATLVNIFFVDVQHPKGIYRKYLTSQAEANRWFQALNSIHARMNGVMIVSKGYETMVQSDF